MNRKSNSSHSLPTVVVVNDEGEKLTTNSLIYASLNQVSLSLVPRLAKAGLASDSLPRSVAEVIKILAWIQQNQPDLIILNLELSQIINLQLVSALRLDWLTRNIPIMIVTNPSQKFQLIAKLDYDLCLTKPYSTVAFEQAICSLLSLPACEVYLQTA